MTDSMVHSAASGSIPAGKTDEPVASDLSAGQRRWVTRRAKYGQAGHAGSYSRFPRAEKGAMRLVIEMLNEGILSEGQVCAATGLDRVDVRRLADEARP